MSEPDRPLRPDALVDLLSAGFDAARLDGEGTRQTITLGGHRVALLHHSAASRDVLGRAFEHLEVLDTGPGDDDLSIRIGVGEGPLTEIISSIRKHHGSATASEFAAESHVLRQRSKLVLSEPFNLTWWDEDLRQGGWWVDDPPPMWLVASPLLELLHIWGSTVGLPVIHGAAVGVDDRLALLGARGGSGKSTLAIACLLEGMMLCGDDYYMLETGHEPTAHSLYATAKLDPMSRQLLDRPSGNESRNGGSRWNLTVMPRRAEHERIVVDLVDHPALVANGSVAALVVPQLIPGSAAKLSEISPSDALRSFATTAAMQVKTNRAVAVRAIAQCCSHLPCYRLEVGDEPRRAADILRTMLS